MDEDILAMLLTAIVIFVPVAGLTLRFAFKPIVDSIARLLEVRAQGANSELLEKRVGLLEREVAVLRGELAQAREKTDFYEKLNTPSAPQRVTSGR